MLTIPSVVHSRHHQLLAAALLCLGSGALRAQAPHTMPAAIIDTTPEKRSGPRYGVLWLSPALVDSIQVHEKHQRVNGTTSLFGWEFQTQLLRNPGGAAPITNVVLGIAGLDQGLVLPTATWLVGLRTRDDFEAGIGPNVSVAGAALALTAGRTFRSGSLNIPFDVAWVSSKIGQRVSVTTGFNVMK